MDGRTTASAQSYDPHAPAPAATPAATPADAAFDAAVRAVVRDPARLAAVRATGLLDGAAGDVFDRLTRLAARFVRAPAAFLALVDAERDVYVSAATAGAAGAPFEGTREVTGATFCHHALASAAPLAIADTAADPAYRAVPLVHTPGVAAYLGVPVAVGGQRVGTLCAVDRTPRAWTAEEVEALTELAASAERELALRAAARAADAARGEADAARAGTAAVLEATADAYVALDAEYRMVAVNAAMERACGLPRAQLLGRDFWAVFPGGLGTAIERHYRAAVERGVEAHFTHAYGDARLDLVVEVDAYPVRGAGGAERGGVAIFWRDATARARAEAAAAASEARFRAVQDASPDAVLLLRPVYADGHADRRADGAVVDFEFVYANPAAGRMLGGGAAAALVGRRMLAVFPSSAEEGYFGAYARVFATGEPYTREDRYVRDGLDVGVRVTAVRAGDLVHLRHEDIAGRLRAEAERARLLAEAEAARAEAERRAGVLAAVIQSMPDAVYVGTIAGVTVANRAALDLLGYDTLPELNRGIPTLAEEIRTRDPATGRRLAPEEEAFVRALLGEDRVTQEVLVRHRRTGQDRLVHAVAMPVRGPGGAVAAAVTVSRDVTEARAAAAERERLLAEAEAARAAAEAANQAKAQFLANMSHELRTPLNAIGGYAQLIDMGLHGPVTDDQRAALARVQAAQARLLSLVNDVLNYAKLESGRVEYDLRPVDLADVVRDVAPLVAPQLRAKGLAFDVRLPEVDGQLVPCVVWADREKLGQVLVNLLSNAVKFTDSPHPATGAPGRVTVEVATRPGAIPAGATPAGATPAAGGASGLPGGAAHAGAPGGLAFLRVRDTGRGIPREKQDSIFEPFVQVRAGAGSAYAQATEGTGLGLAISRDLARGMGGDLRVRSAPGEGATFTVSLRRAAADR